MQSIIGYLKRNRFQIRHSIHRIRLYVRRRPVTCTLTALILVTLFYLLYHLFVVSSEIRNHDHHMSGISANGDQCFPMSDPAQAVFVIFVKRLITTLDLLDITYFLCYDSLWTALRRSNAAKLGKKTLKTVLRLSDGCFNICVLNEDLMKHDDALIERRFRNNGIRLQYIHSDGLYILKPGTNIYSQSSISSDNDSNTLHSDIFSIHARIHVFERDSVQDMYRRVGWKSRLIPSTMCKQLHCFPPSLIEDRPLPQLEFISLLFVNVPREGIEIQKYHFPDTWWTMAEKEDCLPSDEYSTK